jgi:hypothetical protein
MRFSVKDVDDAVELIGPKPNQRPLCWQQTEERIGRLIVIASRLDKIPSPGILRKELDEIARDLEKFKKALRQYSKVSVALLYTNNAILSQFRRQSEILTYFSRAAAKQKILFEEIDSLIEAAVRHSKNLVVPPGSRRYDHVKASAALYSDQLMRSFGSAPPTKTVDGAFYRLAALLHKTATGKDANIEQYCREVGRSGLTIVGKMTVSDIYLAWQFANKVVDQIPNYKTGNFTIGGSLEGLRFSDLPKADR